MPLKQISPIASFKDRVPKKSRRKERLDKIRNMGRIHSVRFIEMKQEWMRGVLIKRSPVLVSRALVLRLRTLDFVLQADGERKSRVRILECSIFVGH